MKWQDVFSRQAPATPIQMIRNTFNDTLPLFSIPLGQETGESWTVWLSEDALWERVRTLSHVALLDEEGRKEGREVLRRALREEGNGVEWNERGEVACHGVTFFAWTDRLYDEFAGF